MEDTSKKCAAIRVRLRSKVAEVKEALGLRNVDDEKTGILSQACNYSWRYHSTDIDMSRMKKALTDLDNMLIEALRIRIKNDQLKIDKLTK